MPDVIFDPIKLTVTDSNSQTHELWHNEYWYLSPNRTCYSKEDGKIGPFSFAMVLHNAKLGQGIHIAMEDLLEGISVKVLKPGNAGKAEQLIEEERLKIDKTLPSRLRCFYLNQDKETAEYRIKAWGFSECELVRCYSIRSSSFYHHADVRIFEQLAMNPSDTELAKKYWEPFTSNNKDEKKYLEVLVNGALYFPDWKSFPTLNQKELLKWQENNKNS